MFRFRIFRTLLDIIVERVRKVANWTPLGRLIQTANLHYMLTKRGLDVHEIRIHQDQYFARVGTDVYELGSPEDRRRVGQRYNVARRWGNRAPFDWSKVNYETYKGIPQMERALQATNNGGDTQLMGRLPSDIIPYARADAATTTPRLFDLEIMRRFIDDGIQVAVHTLNPHTADDEYGNLYNTNSSRWLNINFAA